jgi:hypothetical protein
MWRCNASIAEREQFRGSHAAKVRKIIQKTAFGEDINTISDTNTVQFVNVIIFSDPTILICISSSMIYHKNRPKALYFQI